MIIFQYFLCYGDIVPKRLTKIFTYRCYSRRNYEQFKSLISAYDWQCLYNIVDTHEAFLYFHENISRLYKQAFPKTSNKIYDTRKPWLTECLKLSIKKRNMLYVISKKHPTARNDQVYKVYKIDSVRL